MVSNDELAASQRYVRSREVFRERARTEFFAKEHARSLVKIINDYVAQVMFAGSGQSMSAITHAEYIGGLLVSFTRTHFIAIDLIVCSELIESATLLRKQFELIARLQELNVSEPVNNLLERTPNLRALKTEVRKLYGEYSRIAHSAHPEPLQLLGRIERQEGDYTALYPTFDENAYVALNHATACVVEYHSWAHPFCSQHYQTYDLAWGEAWLTHVAKIHQLLFVNVGVT
jgi:hypothetical protein